MQDNTIANLIEEALGEASALFMSKECKGTEIVMPTEELIRISKETASKVGEHVEKLLNN